MSRIRQIKDKQVARLFSKYPKLLQAWTRHSDFIENTDTPWTKLTKKVKDCRLALVTTGGVHLSMQDGFNMNDSLGDPTFREIPADIQPKNFIITHNYYDHTDADKDINIIFPMDRVHDLARAGEIGSVNHRHFSFMGHIKGHHIGTLINETAEDVAMALLEDDVDIVILTPT